MDGDRSRGPVSHASSPTDPATVDSDAADFAEYLRAERERRQLTLEQVADETKIAPRHLEALERGDVRNWPGGMYRRAMMRAYAESIGVDREFALKQFEQVLDTPQRHDEAAFPVPAPPAPVAAPRIPEGVRRLVASRRQTAAAGASVLSIVALAIAWNLYTSLRGRSDPPVMNTSAIAAAPTAVSPEPPRPATPASPPSESRQASPVTTRPVVAATTRSVPGPALASDGTLVIESDPPGARVTVNGVGWGETPLTVRHLEFGSKRIRLTLQDHVSDERGVSLAPDRPSARVRVQLRQR
jgi:cytoskeletal protein RodZ